MESRNLNSLSDNFLYKQIKIRSQQSPMYISHREHKPTFGKCGWNNAERQIWSSHRLTTKNCTVQSLVSSTSLQITEISILPRNMADIENSVMSYK